MEVKVIKGTKQIGGCITSIKTRETEIIVDFGEDLDDEARRCLDRESLLASIEGAAAVFITHSHGDHVGLVNMIPSRIRVFMEEMTKRIVEVSADFGICEPLTRPVETFKLTKGKVESIVVGDIIVTPYIVDHSAYNSCMFLIEGEGKRVLHTGDYRNHGRKGPIFEDTLRAIGQVDCLITEGTTLSREDGRHYMSEFALEAKARKLIEKYDQVFVLASSTNIDRIVTFYKARGDKSFVMDTFTSAITRAIDFAVTTSNPDVYQWNPAKYVARKSEEFKAKYMTGKYDYGFLPNYVMFVKQSMMPDIRKLVKLGLATNACLVYSMWNGYLDESESLRRMVDELSSMGISMYELHTSGHADVETMRLLYDISRPEKVVVIHTDGGEKGRDVFPCEVALEDGEELII